MSFLMEFVDWFQKLHFHPKIQKGCSIGEEREKDSDSNVSHQKRIEDIFCRQNPNNYPEPNCEVNCNFPKFSQPRFFVEIIPMGEKIKKKMQDNGNGCDIKWIFYSRSNDGAGEDMGGENHDKIINYKISSMPGKLYIVATPIGNLEDITLRALKILREVDLILCEDTRVTKKLLDRYEIQKPLLSYHHHSKLSRVEKIIEHLENGKNLALVSDAGTPGISDPGNELIASLGEGFEIVPIPGSSAPAALASVAGINMSRFMFLGFPPHKKGRETFFREVAEAKYPVIFFESPHRFLKNLELLEKFRPNAKLVVGRELTKMFEEIARGEIGEVKERWKEARVKGEFVIIVHKK